MQASNSAGHVFGDVLRIQYGGLEFTEHDCRATADICRRPCYYLCQIACGHPQRNNFLEVHSTDPTEARLPQLVDITSSTGTKFSHLSSPEAKNIVESMSGGVAVIDYNRDGWPDIYFTNAQSAAMTHAGKGRKLLIAERPPHPFRTWEPRSSGDLPGASTSCPQGMQPDSFKNRVAYCRSTFNYGFGGLFGECIAVGK